MRTFKARIAVFHAMAATVLTLAVFGLSALAGLSQQPRRLAHFVGSEDCKRCHEEQFNGWKRTRMANVVRDLGPHPDAVLGDFAQSNPLRTFTLDDVAFVYGSRYKQRYFTRRGDDYYPLPAQWDIAKKR